MYIHVPASLGGAFPLSTNLLIGVSLTFLQKQHAISLSSNEKETKTLVKPSEPQIHQDVFNFFFPAFHSCPNSTTVSSVTDF